MLIRLYTVVIAITSLSALQVAHGADRDNAMDPAEKVAEMFAAFDKHQDPGFVYQALDIVETVQRETAGGNREACARTLALSLSFLAALDRRIDTTWNAKDTPIRPVPPPIPGALVTASGEIDPASIPDPKTREHYEQELAVSKQTMVNYNAQFQLRRIDERATIYLRQFVPGCYSRSRADQSEIDNLIDASPLSAARKKFLRRQLRRTWHD
jgi:hypothetical protein